MRDRLSSLLQRPRVATLRRAVRVALGRDEPMPALPVPAEAPPEAPVETVKIVEVPVELLFTEGRHPPVDRPTRAWREFHNRWANLPLARLTPHRELFSFFLHRGPYPDEYIEWHRQVYATRGLEVPLRKELVVEERHKHFRVMKQAFDARTSFFKDAPVQVEWNPAGYFNMLDGHHRAMFLYCNGARRVWCQMSPADFDRWADPVREQPVIDALNRVEGPIYTPMLGHGAMRRSVERDWYSPTRLDRILEFLGPARLSGRTVLDIGSNVGFYAHHFAREGAVVTAVEPNAQHVAACRALGELHQLKYTLLDTPFEETALEPHEVGIMLTVLYHFVDDAQRGPRFLRKLSESVTKLLFWESGPDPVRERALIHEHTRFKHFHSLGLTYGTGKARELGVFSMHASNPVQALSD